MGGNRSQGSDEREKNNEQVQSEPSKSGTDGAGELYGIITALRNRTLLRLLLTNPADAVNNAFKCFDYQACT